MNQIEAGKGIACAGSQPAVARAIQTSAAAQHPAVRPLVMLAIADPALAHQLTADLARLAIAPALVSASTLARLRELSRRTPPVAIAFDTEFLQGAPVLEPLRALAAAAPLVVLGPAESQAGFAGLVAAGNADFVARTGNFLPLVSALIARRCRWARFPDSSLAPPWAGSPPNVGEIVRHEINNPLTGILGNAELVLAHRERLLPVQIQRLQTVVELAVRLRETIRRLTDAWESAPGAPQSP